MTCKIIIFYILRIIFQCKKLYFLVATFPLFNQRLPVKRPILTLPTIVDGEEQKTFGGRKNYTNVFQSNNVTRRGVVGVSCIG